MAGVTPSRKVPTSRQVKTTAPLTGGAALTGDVTIAIPAATDSVAGYMTAADHASLSGKGNPELINGLVALWGLGEASGATRLDVARGHSLTDHGTVTQTTGKIGNAPCSLPRRRSTFPHRMPRIYALEIIRSRWRFGLSEHRFRVSKSSPRNGAAPGVANGNCSFRPATQSNSSRARMAARQQHSPSEAWQIRQRFTMSRLSMTS